VIKGTKPSDIVAGIALVALVLVAVRPQSKVATTITGVVNGWEAATASLLHTGTTKTKAHK
jgi:hypothetical protein